MKKLILFGTGIDCKEILERLLPFIWLKEVEVIGILDNDTSMCGKEFMGYLVDEPSNINQYEYDLIIITPVFHQVIFEQLQGYGVSGDKIKSVYSLPYFSADKRRMMNNVIIGRHSYFKGHSQLQNCIIGNFVCMGDYVRIGLSGHNTGNVTTYPLHNRLLRDYRSLQFTQSARQVVVGGDVYLGEGCVIYHGVEIGDGAVVAARSVVTKDVPPYAVVGGIPAKIIKFRFSPEIVSKLLKIAWWEWDDEKIKENVDYFYGHVEEFINKFHER